MFSVPLDFAQQVSPAAPDAGLARFGVSQFSNGKPEVFLRGASGRLATLQAALGRRRMGYCQGDGDSTVISKIGMDWSNNGTATIAATSNTSFYTLLRRTDILRTAAATNNCAGNYSTAAGFSREAGFHFMCRFGCATGQAATTRGFCGLTSIISAPTDVDPSTIADVLGMGWDTADSSVQIMHRTGSGTTAKESQSSLGFPIPTVDNTDVFEFEMYCAPGDSSVYWKITKMNSGSTNSGVLTSDLPGSTTLLAPRVYMSVAGVSSVIGISFMSLCIETEV